MNTKQLTKLFFVALLALFATVGSGIVAQQIGINVGPIAHACGQGGGGGC
jgi:hypothetical protein